MTHETYYVQHGDLQRRAAEIATQLTPGVALYGIPRGGIPAMYAVMAMKDRRGPFRITSHPQDADVFIDDIIDSGATRATFAHRFPGVPFHALYDKSGADKDMRGLWHVFPWEDSEEFSADDICTRLLQFIGEDPTRGGLKETPARFLKAWRHWTKGYGEDPAEVLKTFEDGAANYDEMVVEKNIPAWSTCEHHLAAVRGVAHVGYIPNGKIVGLSKLNRLVDTFGRRLQVQERWTTQIADALVQHLNPKGVAVVIEAEHMCMSSRGVCHQDATTITSAMRGALMDKPEARAEFLRLIGK